MEAVARRVVELMRREGDASPGRRLVDAATLAAELGVKRSWVYEHRDWLGAVQLGMGAKPRLRFDIRLARDLLGSHDDSRSSIPDDGGTPNAARPTARHQAGPAPSPGRVLAVRLRRKTA
ncbi:MAG: hypothetical protein ACHQDY_03610 [Solirubrobacterales bacterium]